MVKTATIHPQSLQRNARHPFMEFGPIPPKAYADPETYALEMHNIWSASWVCIGLTDDLAQPNDFLTTKIGDHAIVVQNTEHGLKAFRNMCSHRFAQIQTERCGNRLLRCPYHGWTYNANGVPIGIPDNERQFGFTKTDKQSLKLLEYALETVGRFVFVKLSQKGTDLKTYLGDWYEILVHLSETFTERVEVAEHVWNANWKIGIENALESYHVHWIHSQTFDKIFQDIDLNIETHLEHSAYDGPLSLETAQYWEKTSKLLNIKRSERFPAYKNFLIFPNLLLTLSYGTNMTWQVIEPVGPEHMRFRSELFIAPSSGTFSAAARKETERSLVKFSQAIRSEDEDICAQVHANIKQADRGQLFAQVEQRLMHFQKCYMSRLNTKI